MDAQEFLAEFGHIANAPNGVGQLRELVLAFAIQGRLVPQLAHEEPADDFLSRLGVDRHASGRQRSRMSSFNTQQSISKLPKGWSVVSLGRLAFPQAGFAFKSSQFNEVGNGMPIVRVRDVGTSRPQTYYSGEYREEFIVRPGDWLIAMDGDFRVAEWCADDALLNQRVTRLRFHSDELEKKYVCIALQFELRKLQGIKNYTTVDHLSSSQIAEAAIALPSPEEQSRIVAKVDELVDLCGQLEKQQQDRRKLQDALRQSTLQALASAQSPHELQDSWQRLQANFGRLFSEPEDVRGFKGLVLDLAVSGLLLPTSDEPTQSASELIEQIAHARTEWAKTAEEQEKKEAVAMLKKLRTQQVAAPSASLPDHWCWSSLLQIAQAVVDCHNKTAPYVMEGIHLVRTTDIRDGRMDLSKTKKISPETYSYWARRMPPKSGDIFFTREAPMGEAAIVPEGERVCLGQRTMLIRLFPQLFSNRYLIYVIRSPSFQSRMSEAAIGMTVKHLRVGGVEDLVVPVPPRVEQDQIVEVVDRLFELCDRYAEDLGKSRRFAQSLSTAAVVALTGIGITQEDEALVKAPQTELIAPLRLASPPDVKTEAPLATLLASHNGEMSARDLWQRFGGEIDTFYAQLKTEVAHGWIAEPAMAQVRERPAEAAEA
jgi:type I restriction enzyme, S subunit